MRKMIMMTVILAVSSLASPALAQDAGHKLYRGAVNIITAPVEIPKQARAYWITGAQKTDHILVWIGTGAVWGFIQGVKRVGSGVWDIVSFPVARPAAYEPLFKPAYVFDEWPRNPKSGR